MIKADKPKWTLTFGTTGCRGDSKISAEVEAANEAEARKQAGAIIANLIATGKYR